MAELVRNRRLQLRLTQREAAAAAGLSVATWQTLERTRPRQRFQELTLSAAAQALDLPLTELLAAAGRGHSPEAAPTGKVDDLPSHLRELVPLLERLRDRSVEDLAFVTGQASQLATYLLERASGRST